MFCILLLIDSSQPPCEVGIILIFNWDGSWEVNRAMVLELESDPTSPTLTTGNTKPHCLPSLSRDGAGRIRGPQCQVLQDRPCWYCPAQDPQETGEDLPPSTPYRAWVLMTVIRISSSPVTIWEQSGRIRPPVTHGEI